MGREKLSIEVGGVPLIQHVQNTLASCCNEVLVVGGGGIRLEGVRYVTGERPGGHGPLAGIEAGLAAARFDHVFVAAGDMPFLAQSLVGYLLERLAREDATVVVPRYGGRTHPLCAAYDRALCPLVSRSLDRGVRAVHGFLEETAGVEYIEEELRRFGDPDLLLMNVNSPSDLDRARRRAGR
ncbi:molybdenum cofactor guanylyltransferase [soil metagenome]